jgi:hypothetical protein
MGITFKELAAFSQTDFAACECRDDAWRMPSFLGLVSLVNYKASLPTLRNLTNTSFGLPPLLIMVLRNACAVNCAAR